MYIVKLIGLPLVALLLFIGRFGMSAVASDQVVITPITDQPVSHLVVQHNSVPFRLGVPPVQPLEIQPINQFEIMRGAPALSQNLTHPPQTEAVPPVDLRPCAHLFAEVTAVFGDRVTKTETPFTDKALGMSGLDCQFTVVRTSSDAEDYLTVAQTLKTSLEATGWREDETYIAYGPGEVTLALQQHANSGMLTVGQQLFHNSDCSGIHSATCVTEAAPYRYEILFSYTVAPLPPPDSPIVIRSESDYQE